jgi:hypothetical protein
MNLLRRRFVRNLCATGLAAASLLSVTGCQRSQDAFDDRTLEKRPHVETVKPEDRKDAFRP